MRYMMFMIPPEYQPGAPAATKAGEGFAPPAEAVAAMMKYNEELANAGVLISLDGLHPMLKGARVTFRGGKTAVTDGPFVEAKEVIGGYWMLDVPSKEEALEWAKRCPAVKVDFGAILEIRQVFETSEFPEEARKAAENATVRAQLDRRKHAQNA